MMKRNRTGASKQKKVKFSMGSFLAFYTRFPIPWWLYILSALLGVVYTELLMRTAAFTIRINKGELYNSVIIGYALLTVLNAALSMLQNVLSAYGSEKITLRARKLLWNKILHMPLREVERRQPSALFSGVVNDVAEASSVITMLSLTVSSVYGFGRSCLELYRFNATLTCYILLLIPLNLLLFYVVGRIQHRSMRLRFESLNTMTEFFSEHISAAKHVKAHAMEDREVEEGLRAINERYKADIYYGIMSQVQVLFNSTCSNLGTVVTALFGSDMIRRGRMPDTGINDFSTYLTNVERYKAELLTHYQTLTGTQGAMRYVGVLMNGPQEVLDSGYDLPETRETADIVLDHVSFGYDPEFPVLHDLSVTIPHGKITAIIGNNGSGKSTLLKLLQGLYPPDSGRILLGEADIASVKPEQLRAKFGYILQNNPLLSGSIRDNITYGMKGEVPQEAVAAAARLADADEFINALPQGYDTDIGEGGKLLSGGQRQRLAIARTLMRNPDYLLMDEAGASLDHKSDTTIFRNVRESLKGRTIVVVAHDMRSVVDADYIIVLNHGDLEAAGAHEQLLANSPTYRGYLEKQGYDVGEGAQV